MFQAFSLRLSSSKRANSTETSIFHVIDESEMSKPLGILKDQCPTSPQNPGSNAGIKPHLDKFP
ncbi:hypothetical protein SLEP1_g19665 [Rubroshorea leprosula]|uniref:Uncharacterized protein n=1 Tax=Rubroshorea leprosula TaxID=152421 RepID=A0AAV5J5M5_9ROSI|nr:hypothetical protein SLEP1_g19665 [Rubroshorea leprosula]